MSHPDFAAVWKQTEKAAKYLRSKGARYYTHTVPYCRGELCMIHYTFADIGDMARAHVAKAYPNALVSFAAPEVVKREIARIDDAFIRATHAHHSA